MKKSLAFKILLELNRSIGNIQRIIENQDLSKEELLGEKQAIEDIRSLIAEISENYK